MSDYEKFFSADMPVEVDAETPFILISAEVTALWVATSGRCACEDIEVVVRVVDEQESRRLNLEYRKKDTPTNVLTFNYEGAADIALCLPVAEREATERGVALRDYVALLLVHAFLHAAGMDHERSHEEAARMSAAEHDILAEVGFATIYLE